MEKHGRETILGVWRNPDKLGKEPNPEFRERFKEHKWPGKSNQSWEWYIRVEKYYDWNAPETLVKMYCHTDEVIDYFEKAMCKAAKIAEPLIVRGSKR